jgi:hypothetical protein
MNAIVITKSPFHSKETLTMAQAHACTSVFQFAGSRGRAWKTDWLQTQTEFVFDKKLSAASIRHFAGELRNIGEYITRQGYTIGLRWHDAAANSRGGHNIKKDTDPTERRIHTLAVDTARKMYDKTPPNTLTAQVLFLRNDEKGTAALARAKSQIEQAEKEARRKAREANKK